MSLPDLQIVKETIPAQVRRTIYVVYALLVIADGGTQAGYAAAQLTQPTALVIATAVLLFLGTPVSVLAAVNVNPPLADAVPQRALDADGDGQPDYVD